MQRRGFLKAVMGAVASVAIMRAQLLEGVLEEVVEVEVGNTISVHDLDAAMKAIRDNYGAPSELWVPTSTYYEIQEKVSEKPEHPFCVENSDERMTNG